MGSALTPPAPAVCLSCEEQIFVHDLRRLPPGHTWVGRVVCWLHRTPRAYLALLYWKGVQVFKVGRGGGGEWLGSGWGVIVHFWR